jgi:UDPglucose--hexose-1-phosphate uridylyltransferase
VTYERYSVTGPDGRNVRLYAREPLRIDPGARALLKGGGSPHLRWHPLRSEWVVVAAHRQERTFLPPRELDPLAPSSDPGRPTEIPAGNWEVAVFDNRFPSLAMDAGEAPPAIVPTARGVGACEVVVYTQSSSGSLGALPLDRIELIVSVWAERTREIGAHPDIHYVFPFENRGEVVGVTLHHPHGQIYAYPFVPPVPARELASQDAHLKSHGTGLLQALLDAEVADGRRLVFEGEHVVAWVPVCARYAYEVWVAPRRPAPDLAALTDEERSDLARALKTVILKYDGLWGSPMPYLMVIHQAPTDGKPHPEAHVHVEFYPPMRSKGRLKYLAGTEIGAGVFAADTLPEDKAAELRAVDVVLS